MMTGLRYLKLLVGLTVSLSVVGCKTLPKNSSSRSVPSDSGHAGDWVTPLNLVDINAPVQDATKVSLIGEIERITLDTPSDVFSSGVIEMSGMRVIIPANLIIQMPVQRYTLQELFTQAPSACLVKNQTGLALSDDCFFERRGAQATILANRTGSGVVIAGDVKIAKAAEIITGVVTYIDHTQGYFRLNGAPTFPASKTTGVMVRINDPQKRHSLQSGLGCDGGTNCSPDQRFPVDSDNYTASFITGYPLCLPSTVVAPRRRSVVSFNLNNGVVTGTDTFCPFSNRPINPSTTPVADSRFFAPLKVGDSLVATGNFESIGKSGANAYFLSAHTIQAHVGLRTSPGKPDYLTFSETIWEVAGFPRQRARAGYLGFSTNPNSELDLYRLAIDPNDPNEGTRQHEVPLASTVGNPRTFNLGVPPTVGHIFRIRYKIDFLLGAVGKLSPCIHLSNGGLNGGCASGATLDPSENFSVVSPISREVILHTRNKTANPNLVSFDLSGAPTPNGEYLAPIEIEHPAFEEVNLNRIQTPYLFTGEPWNLDRRLGPQGCGGSRGSCSQAAPLAPFPSDGGLNPMMQNVTGANLPDAAANRMIMSYPYTNVDNGPLLPWATVDVSNALKIAASTPVIFSQCVAAP